MAYPPPPYKDAVCGVPVSGEAICGTWWAYPARGTLTLAGRQVTILTPPVMSVVPVRGVLRLVGRQVDFAGQDWLHDLDCVDFDLAPAACSDRSLVAAGTREMTLAALDCR